MKKYLYRYLRSMVVGFVLVVIASSMFPINSGTRVDQRHLDRLIQKMDHMQRECDNPELAELMAYTSETYNTIGWSGINIAQLGWASAAGMNNPLVPGMTLDRDCFDAPDIYVIGLMLHEAMHDYPPYVGHSHMYDLVPVHQNRDNAYDNMDHNRDW